MPAFTGPITIANISGGDVRFGDIAFQGDKSSSKSNNGSGAANTGGIVITLNGTNINNVLNASLTDLPIVANR